MTIIDRITPETLAELFHTAYEKLAPEHGYETRKDTRQFDPQSPNGKLMIATSQAVLTTLRLYELRRVAPATSRAEE